MKSYMYLFLLFILSFTIPTPSYCMASSLNKSANQDFQVVRRAVPASDEPLVLSVTVATGGSLKELLGDNLLKVDTLTVDGTINNDDIYTLFTSSLKGRLKVLDMGKAVLEGGKLPANAFFHASEQCYEEYGVVYVNPILIEKIVLPSNVTEIGDFAFMYESSLQEIGFPESLVKIRDGAFSFCRNLSMDPLVFPSKLEEIGEKAFENCTGLTGEVVLPQTIRRIENGAFYICQIQKINFPESLEYLGMSSFCGNNLTEVDLPDGCEMEYEFGSQFSTNYKLKCIHLPENITKVPSKVCNECSDLEEVNIPSTVTRIGTRAFDGCSKLGHVAIPEGVTEIANGAFYLCESLAELIFPSTLVNIGPACFFGCKNVKRIECKATVPPVCGRDKFDPWITPFGTGMPTDMGVYIPVGSKEAYTQAWGWNSFTNFIETDSFTSVDALETDCRPTDDSVYDLYGRKTSHPVPGRIYIRKGRKYIE